jgi:hypothetical protein
MRAKTSALPPAAEARAGARAVPSAEAAPADPMARIAERLDSFLTLSIVSPPRENDRDGLSIMHHPATVKAISAAITGVEEFAY